MIVGCAFPEGEQGMNMARLIALLAHLPISVAGTTVNRFCGSSMQAIHMAAGAIQLDAGEVFVCAGVESMTRVPIGGYNPLPSPRLVEEYPQAYDSMGVTAENVARSYQITRDAQEAFAVESHRKAAAAQSEGRLRGRDRADPAQRRGDRRRTAASAPETSQEALAGLKPAFDENGTVTAGTSSPLTDGAAAVAGLHRGLRRRSTASTCWRGIRSVAVAGCARRGHGHRPGRGDAARRSRAPGSRSATSRWSSSTRPSPRRRSPACATSRSTPRRSTSTAARSRSAIRSAPPAPGSPARRRRC